MSAAFTPGPWTYQYSQSVQAADEFSVMSKDDFVLAWVVRDEDAEGGPTGGTVEANARLIAVAPEMYAALVAIANRVKRVNGADHTCGDCRECYGIADETLAKAEGRAP